MTGANAARNKTWAAVYIARLYMYSVGNHCFFCFFFFSFLLGRQGGKGGIDDGRSLRGSMENKDKIKTRRRYLSSAAHSYFLRGAAGLSATVPV